VWEYIEKTFLPEWQEQQGGRVLNVWSAASSTGEEAHTLGILLQHYKDSHAGFDYKIQGTDIDTTVIDRATQGVYAGRSIERFRHAMPEWFKKYMQGNDSDGYVVVPEIKKRLNFSHFNLFSTPPVTPKFDLVLVRNVLIYFTPGDQESVMSTVYKRLEANGVVIIGESESLNNLKTDFQAVAPTIYRPSSSAIEKAA
ncbi:MAG: protein-glutamate O-methyltransferase CheR, partial [Granulosicoccus sp.]